MRTFFETVAGHARQAPDRIAFTDTNGALTRSGLLGDAARLAAALPPRARVVGLFLPNGREWTIAQLACVMSGRICVPLPTFFSAQQLAHIVQDAGIELVLALDETLANLPSGVARAPVAVTGEGGAWPDVTEGFGTIIYTSGSTGHPKGVRHESGQVAWAASALAAASGAQERDSYLSVLPVALLLETICALFVPALVGGRTHFETEISQAVGRGDASGLAAAYAAHRPSTGVLVPELLRALVAQLLASGQRAPDGLRFVAVGGATVPPRLAEAACQLGIPVHEGYGLSECCSVVAVNRPGARAPGTVGAPLAGLTVSIRDGEILVDGPSVMDGYLGGAAAPRPWPTGDLGAFDAEGRLMVFGRKDNLIVTALGRNVSPEWVETAMLDDPGIAFCAVAEAGGGIGALIVPTHGAASWFADADSQAIVDRAATRCAALPAYARPTRVGVIALAEAKASGLLTDNGRIRRAIAGQLIAGLARPAASPAPSLIPERLQS